MDPPSTQVFSGPWGDRDLPSVGGRFPSLQRHGVIRKGRLHKPPDSPHHCHCPVCCILGTYCTVPAQPPRIQGGWRLVAIKMRGAASTISVLTLLCQRSYYHLAVGSGSSTNSRSGCCYFICHCKTSVGFGYSGARAFNRTPTYLRSSC